MGRTRLDNVVLRIFYMNMNISKPGGNVNMDIIEYSTILSG